MGHREWNLSRVRMKASRLPALCMPDRVSFSMPMEELCDYDELLLSEMSLRQEQEISRPLPHNNHQMDETTGSAVSLDRNRAMLPKPATGTDFKGQKNDRSGDQDERA